MSTEMTAQAAQVDSVVSVRRWRQQPPDRDGWWKFREHGTRGVQSIFVIDGHVADDSDWEDAMGRAPSETMCENYWEGNSVVDLSDGTLTRGLWMFERAL